MNFKPQVSKDLYAGADYLSPARMASFGYQVQEVLSRNPSSVLEIGIGCGVVAYLLRKAGVNITTLDFDPSLEPDMEASVTSIPLPDQSYDVVACFEVLEHLPWEEVGKALSEIHRVSSRYVLISLPHAGPRFRVHIPFLCRWKNFKKPFWRPSLHVFDGQHYWEIDRKGYPLSRIIEAMTHAGFTLEKTFRPWEMLTHRFFILKKQELRRESFNRARTK
jgi:ubiquinone/menaquinone biosynthesis C-methylase UbiE